MSECNGWTNYATWRVNLEIFSDMQDASEFFDLKQDAYDLKDDLESWVEEHIAETTQEGTIAQNYALAFIAQVNWYEIAKHLKDNHEEEEHDEFPTDESRSYGSHLNERW